MIVNNHSLQIPIRQHFSENNCELPLKRSHLYTINNELVPLLSNNAATIISCLSPSIRESLDLIVRFCKRYKQSYFSQEYIASRLNLSREWINKIIKKLCEYGLISKVYRHRDTCLYKLSEWFNNLDWTWSLRKVLKSLSIHVYQLKFTPKERTVNSNSSYLSYPSFEEIVRQEKKDKIHEKRRLVMIEASKLLHLTALGIAELSSFPPEALKYGVSILKTKNGLKDPYAFFFKVCLNYCIEKGLGRNRDITRQMVENQGLDLEGPKVDAEKVRSASRGKYDNHSPVYSNSTSASSGNNRYNYVSSGDIQAMTEKRVGPSKTYLAWKEKNKDSLDLSKPHPSFADAVSSPSSNPISTIIAGARPNIDDDEGDGYPEGFYMDQSKKMDYDANMNIF